MFRKLWRLFQARRRYCRLWLPQEAQTLKGPGLPAVDLAVTPIETKPVSYVPGAVLAQDRAKKGLKTIKLEPFPWLKDDSWINSGLLPLPPNTGPLSALHQLLDTDTVHNLPRVKEFHEKRNGA